MRGRDTGWIVGLDHAGEAVARMEKSWRQGMLVTYEIKDMSAEGRVVDSQLISSVNGLVYMGVKSGTGPLQVQRLVIKDAQCAS